MASESQQCTDPAILDLWHPVAAESELTDGQTHTTLLLGFEVLYGLTDGEPFVEVTGGESLPVLRRYGFIWTTLGSGERDLFTIPEASEPDRRHVAAGSIMVAASAPRVIENFLDMGHFPYVHSGLLGEEPHTEVVDYSAQIEDNEVWARDCFFYQPMAAASASGGQMSEYTYRVPHPYCCMLFKNVPNDPTRRDVVAIFVQPMTEETVRAHNYVCLVDSASSETALKQFQQIIFSQDKPILENQHPKRLPLDPRIETPIRADQTAIVYRRWLTDLGIRYAVIPAS